MAARKSIESALTAVAEVKRPETKARLLTRITQAQVIAGDMDAALATLKSAEDVIPKVEDPQGRILVYCDVAGGYQSLDQAADCDRTFEAALDFAKSITDAKKRCPLLAELAAKQAELHETEAATKTFDLALESAGTIEKAYFRAYAMGDIAERLSKAGFRIKAKRVLEQAEGVAEKVPERDMQMQAVQRVRSLMGKLPRGEG
jgi:tetratricopeptide (TPR) repeat protein